MTRLADHPGLRGDEIAYATGDETWPTARVRVTPEDAAEAERLHQPNVAPMPLRVAVRLSASLIDAEGAVERVAGRLLLGPESVHCYQFDAATPFAPEAWIDQCAALVIGELLKQARVISAAATAGLLAEPAAPQPEEPAGLIDLSLIGASEGEA